VIAVGLDLGQVGDFAALAALEPVGEALHARHLDRWRRVSYPDSVRRVAALFATPELKGAMLVVDATGVGLAVYQALQEAMPNVSIIGASVTSGASVSSKGDGRFGVPKVDLIDACRLLLEQGKLRISEQLPLAKVLIQEFIGYQVRVTKHAHETFGAASGAHDDLLFSTALAAWYFTAATPPTRARWRSTTGRGSASGRGTARPRGPSRRPRYGTRFGIWGSTRRRTGKRTPACADPGVQFLTPAKGDGSGEGEACAARRFGRK
jgi:hypothetical protein